MFAQPGSRIVEHESNAEKSLLRTSFNDLAILLLAIQNRQPCLVEAQGGINIFADHTRAGRRAGQNERLPWHPSSTMLF